MTRSQLKAWKAASRKATLGLRPKMIGKPHTTKPTLRQARQAWKKNLKRSGDDA